MLVALGDLWRFWTTSWRAPRRARLLYAAMAAGFLALAVVGGVRGDAVVTVLSAVFGAVTAVLAALAPRLARWTNAKAE